MDLIDLVNNKGVVVVYPTCIKYCLTYISVDMYASVVIRYLVGLLCPHKVAAYRVALVRKYVPKMVSDLILENYLSNPHQTLHTCL